MNEKTKVVEVQGMRYQIRRMRPNVGSFILTRVIAAGASAASMERPDANMLQGMFAAFLRGLDFDTFSFIQNNALSVIARLDRDGGGGDLPMPIVSDGGVFADMNVADDLSLTMALTVQSLIFNLSSFFSEGGLNTLIPR